MHAARQGRMLLTKIKIADLISKWTCEVCGVLGVQPASAHEMRLGLVHLRFSKHAAGRPQTCVPFVEELRDAVVEVLHVEDIQIWLQGFRARRMQLAGNDVIFSQPSFAHKCL
jgi:hypothetical protein